MEKTLSQSPEGVPDIENPFPDESGFSGKTKAESRFREIDLCHCVTLCHTGFGFGALCQRAVAGRFRMKELSFECKKSFCESWHHYCYIPFRNCRTKQNY